jgi:hypothetical protein
MQVKVIQKKQRVHTQHAMKNLTKVLFKKIQHSLCHVKEPNIEQQKNLA